MTPETWPIVAGLNQVVKRYAEARISQSKAAEVLGVSRAEFLNELHQRRVPACQVTIEEILEENQSA